MSYRKNVLTAAWVLTLFTVAGSALLNRVHRDTFEKITANEKAVLLQSLHQLVPPQSHDNDIIRDALTIRDAPVLGGNEPVQIYRAIKGDNVVAVVIECIAPDGYSGRIHLLVAVDHRFRVLGARVVDHKETPGLGDAIEEQRSPWIHQLDGKSLQNPPYVKWAVKRDNGAFDQITGATISSRAVMAAVKRCLEYAATNQNRLFSYSL